MTFDLLRRAFAMIARDWVVTAQIVGVLWIATVVCYLLPDLLYFGTPFPVLDDDTAEALPLGYNLAIILQFIGFVLFWSWIAIAWHRYGLRGERPDGLIPHLTLASLLRYLKAAIALSVVGFIAMLPVLILWAVTDIGTYETEGETEFGASSYLISATALVMFNYVTFRLGLILPATAVGHAMTFGQSRAATRNWRGPLLMLSILLTVTLTIGFMIQEAAFGQVIPYILSLALQDAGALVGVCILTLLYRDIAESGGAANA